MTEKNGKRERKKERETSGEARLGAERGLEDERRLAANERELERGRLRQEKRWWKSKASDALEDYQPDLHLIYPP